MLHQKLLRALFHAPLQLSSALPMKKPLEGGVGGELAAEGEGISVAKRVGEGRV